MKDLLEIDQSAPAGVRLRRWNNRRGSTFVGGRSAHSWIEVSFVEAGAAIYKIGSRELTVVRDPRVRRSIECIRARYAEPIGVSELAQAAGMSRFHFGRTFRRETGRSPYRYLVETRLAEAARLLERRSTVTETAFAVGISDV